MQRLWIYWSTPQSDLDFFIQIYIMGDFVNVRVLQHYLQSLYYIIRKYNIKSRGSIIIALDSVNGFSYLKS